MKYLLRAIVSGLFITLLCGCQPQIGVDERWHPVEQGELLPEERPTILVEEYTGQRCVNCPLAAELLTQLSHHHSPNVVTVALHAKRTKQTLPDLESTLAEQLATQFALPSSVPGIMINRRPLDARGLRYTDNRSQWTALIQKALSQPATHRLELTTEAVNGRSLHLSVVGTAVQAAMRGEAVGLALWVVEDVDAPQMVAGEMTPHFAHHNVLRASLLDKPDYQIGSKLQLNLTIPERVKEPKHAKVVAFLYEPTTQQVYQAALLPLGGEVNPPTPKPDEPEEDTPTSDKIEFWVGEKMVTPGSEWVVTSSQLMEDGHIEFESPAIKLTGSPEYLKDKKLRVHITKLDHKDDASAGLYSVCLGRCFVLPSLQESYTEPAYAPQPDDYIILHYGLQKQPTEPQDYALRLSITSDGKELIHWSYRFKYDPGNVIGGEVIPPAPPIPPTPPVPPTPPTPPTPSDTKSNVVVMDFTGQRCPACGGQMGTLQSLLQRLSPHMILVSIHASYGYNVNREFLPPRELRSSYYEHCQVGYFPSMHLNNRPLATPSAYRVREWAEEAINKSPRFLSTLKVELQADRQVKVTFASKANEAPERQELPKQLNLLLWIVQDGMYGFQSNLSDNAQHNHILRGSLNGTWGESYTIGNEHQKLYPLPPIDEWYPPENLAPTNRFNLDKCHVVAILLDADTKEFVDAVKLPLTQ